MALKCQSRKDKGFSLGSAPYLFTSDFVRRQAEAINWHDDTLANYELANHPAFETDCVVPELSSRTPIAGWCRYIAPSHVHSHVLSCTRVIII